MALAGDEDHSSRPQSLVTPPISFRNTDHPRAPTQPSVVRSPGSSSYSSPRNYLNRVLKFSRVQCALLALLSVQTVITVTILSVTVQKIQAEIQLMDPQLKTISTYLAIFIVANVFSIVMAVDLLLNKNVAQLVALDVFQFSMAVYGAVLPGQVKHSLENPGGAVSWNGARVGTSCNMYLSCYGVQYLYGDLQISIIAIPVITGLCSFLMSYLTWLIYKEFGWEIFKQIGADLTLKRILQRKYQFFMLQKFVFFFFVGFSLQFLMLSSDVSTSEMALTIVALPLSLLVILLGGIAVRNEIKWLLGVYYVFWTGAMVYLVYKLNRLYHNDSISSAVKSLTIFSVCTILSLFATGALAAVCYLQFGKGLLEQSPAGMNDSVWLKMIRSLFNRPRKQDGERTGLEPAKFSAKTHLAQNPGHSLKDGAQMMSEATHDARPRFGFPKGQGSANSNGAQVCKQEEDDHRSNHLRASHRMSLD